MCWPCSHYMLCLLTRAHIYVCLVRGGQLLSDVSPPESNVWWVVISRYINSRNQVIASAYSIKSAPVRIFYARAITLFTRYGAVCGVCTIYTRISWIYCYYIVVYWPTGAFTDFLPCRERINQAKSHMFGLNYVPFICITTSKLADFPSRTYVCVWYSIRALGARISLYIHSVDGANGANRLRSTWGRRRFRSGCGTGQMAVNHDVLIIIQEKGECFVMVYINTDAVVNASNQPQTMSASVLASLPRTVWWLKSIERCLIQSREFILICFLKYRQFLKLNLKNYIC